MLCGEIFFKNRTNQNVNSDDFGRRYGQHFSFWDGILVMNSPGKNRYCETRRLTPL